MHIILGLLSYFIPSTNGRCLGNMIRVCVSQTPIVSRVSCHCRLHSHFPPTSDMARGRPAPKQAPAGSASDPSRESAVAGGAMAAIIGSAAIPAPAVPSPYAHLDTTAALAAMEKDTEDLLDPCLYRLTSGLPRHELKAIVSGGGECEAALIEEIRILEAALGATDEDELTPRPPPGKGGAAAVPTHFNSADDMLASDLTAASGYYAVSALLGRLRTPLEPPVNPNTSGKGAAGLQKKRKKAAGAAGAGGSASVGGQAVVDIDKDAEMREKDAALARTRAVMAMVEDPVYVKVMDDPAPLAALCKRISSHRASMVFRRPVNPKEAPGYTGRIPFPIDLSLVKKMVQAGMIKTFKDLHQRMGCIAHNCVKYNGRESDYGQVTRDFEAYVDDSFVACISAYNASVAVTATAATPADASSSGPSVISSRSPAAGSATATTAPASAPASAGTAAKKGMAEMSVDAVKSAGPSAPAAEVAPARAGTTTAEATDGAPREKKKT